MKIEVENLHGNFKKITIEVPSEIIRKHYDDHFKKLQKDAELKGFRKGKAPLDLLRKVYGDSAPNYVTQTVVEQTLFDALKQQQLEPVGIPKVEAGLALDAMNFKYSATFEQMPVIELKDYSSLKIKKEKIEVSPAEVEVALKNLGERLASFEEVPPESGASTGHIVTLDYTATENGELVSEASEKDADLELGNGQLFEGFEKEILGLKAGESKSLQVTFPEAKNESEKTPVSGRTLTFEVQIKKLKKKVLPELNDEFAKKVGPFQNLSELTERIKKDLEAQKEQNQKRKNQETYIRWLIENNPVEVPETMLSSQLEQLAMDAGVQLSQMGLDEKAIETRLKEWGPEMTERATQQVKASLLLGAIADKEKIQVTNDDLRRELIRMSYSSGGQKKPDEIWKEMRERGVAGGFLRQIQELKALDWAVAKAVEGE